MVIVEEDIVRVKIKIIMEKWKVIVWGGKIGEKKRGKKIKIKKRIVKRSKNWMVKVNKLGMKGKKRKKI